MITCTQEVRELFMASHRQVMRITLDNSVMTDTVYAILSDTSEVPLGALSLSDGTEAGADAQWGYFRGYIQDMSDGVEITEDDILVGGFVLDRYSMCTERIEIGSAVSAELTLTLQNMDGTFDAVRFEGAEMHVELGVKDWDTDDPVQWISLGYFTADKQPKNSTTVKVTALDRMVWFDKDIDWSRFTFPCTLKTLIEGACTTCGVTLATDLTTLPNYNYEVTYSPETTLPYRTLIQWGAFLTGTCAQMNEDGELVFRWYTPCGVTITAENRYSHDIEEEDITLTGLYYKSEMGLEYLEGTADYALEMSGCQILQNNVETPLHNIYLARNGFSYRPFSAVIQSAPFLEPLDMITFVDKNDVSHQCIISKTTYTGNASTPVSGVGETATQASYANLTGLTRAQAEAVDDAKKYATNYVSSDASGIMIANMTDGQRYLPSNVPAGVKNTFIDNNSFDVRDGQTSLASFGATSRIGLENGARTEQSSSALRVVGADGANTVTMGAQLTATTTEEETQIIPAPETDAETGTITNSSVDVVLPYELSGQNITLTIDTSYTIPIGSAYSYTGTNYSIAYDGSYTVTITNSSASDITATLQYQVTQPANYGITADTPTNTRLKARTTVNGSVIAEGGIYANYAGNFGLFDTKRASWMIVSDASGIVHIPSLRPKLLYARKVIAPATQYAWNYMNIQLQQWAVIAIRANVNNVFQYLLFFNAASGSSQHISDRPGQTLYIRGGFKADWTENKIYVRWTDGGSAYSQYVFFDQVIGLVRR